MLFVRLLCSVSDTAFTQFESLNLQKTETNYNKILYDIVKFCERCDFERELAIIMQLIMRDPGSRMSPDKIYVTLQNEFL
jgi:hypothetical protein